MKRFLLLTALMLGACLAQNGDIAGRVREEVERTANLIDEFTPLVTRSQDFVALELWRMAQAEQSAAESWLTQGRYRLAARFTFAARGHGRAALEDIQRKADPERLDREVERTDALIARATGPLKVGGDQQSLALLAQAVEWQRQARAALAEKRYFAALKLGLAARDLVLRAWETGGKDAGRELVEQALAENDGLVAEWSQIIRQSDSTQAVALLDQALPHQANAKLLWGAGRRKAALAEAATCRRLLQSAIELVQRAVEGRE